MAKVEIHQSAASLVVYGKIPDLGWRRGSIRYAKNGLPKPGILLIRGREVMAETVVYQIRQYKNRQATYTSVGTEYREALALLERMRNTRQRNRLNDALGVELPKTPDEIAAEKAEAEAERLAKRKTLTQYATEYLAKKKKLSLDSIALYRDTIQPFVDSTGAKYPEDLTGEMVADWYDSLVDDDYAQRTCQTRYIAVRGFLKRCGGINLTDLIDDDTHRRLRKKPDAHTEPYTKEQVEKLLATADPYYRMVFQLLVSTGLRMAEAMNLTWDQVKWDENEILVKGEMVIYHPTARVKNKLKVIRFKTKTGKGRKVPMFPSLKRALLAWRNQNPTTIFVVGTRRDLPNNHWLRYLKIIARDAGINCGTCATCVSKGECEGAYIHRFRHTFAIRCLRGGQNLHQVSKWMGHSSIAVTAIYMSGSPDDAAGDPFASAPTPTPKPNNNVIGWKAA